MHTFVEANGIRIATIEEGAGPLVVLLHGFPDTAHTWDVLRPALAAEGYRVVSPFLRGYPPTEIPPKPTTIEELGHDVLELISALGEEQAVVVGHDWGAIAAYAAAALDPTRVSKLVVAAVPHPLAQGPTPRVLWGFRHFFALNLPGAAKRIRDGDYDYLRELYRRWSPTWDVPDHELDAALHCFETPGALEAAVDYYKTLRAAGPPAMFRTPIACETLAVCGADDPVMRRDVFERADRYHSAGYDVVEIGGGHFLHREFPDDFSAALMEFFSRPELR